MFAAYNGELYVCMHDLLLFYILESEKFSSPMSDIPEIKLYVYDFLFFTSNASPFGMN